MLPFGNPGPKKRLEEAAKQLDRHATEADEEATRLETRAAKERGSAKKLRQLAAAHMAAAMLLPPDEPAEGA